MRTALVPSPAALRKAARPASVMANSKAATSDGSCDLEVRIRDRAAGGENAHGCAGVEPLGKGEVVARGFGARDFGDDVVHERGGSVRAIAVRQRQRELERKGLARRFLFKPGAHHHMTAEGGDDVFDRLRGALLAGDGDRMTHTHALHGFGPVWLPTAHA